MVERNRRQHPRVKLKQVSTRVTVGGALHIGLAVENMSLGGCFVPSRAPFKVGTEVRLEVQRPGASHAISVLGRVVSTATAGPGHATGMGIAFFPMSKETSQRIEGLIGSVAPSAVRANVEASARRTEPEMPAVAPASGLAPAVELAELRSEVRSLEAQLQTRDARIAELEAALERLRRRVRDA